MIDNAIYLKFIPQDAIKEYILTSLFGDSGI